MFCPAPEKFPDYMRGLLPQSEGDDIAAHLAVCADCQATQRWLAEAAELAAADTRQISEPVISHMVNWFRAQPPHPAPTLRELVARLVFDSFGPAQLARVRREGITGLPAERQMFFQAEGFDIDLRLESDNGEDFLIGQILPTGEKPVNPVAAVVELHQAGQIIADTQVDEQGMFRLRQIPSGYYELSITLEDIRIHIMPQAGTPE